VKRDGLDCSETNTSEGKPQAIEKILHKYELEIRAHVKLELEFKKIAEESEKRYESLKNELNAVSGKYNKMLDRLSNMAYEKDHLTDELSTLKSFLAEVDLKEGAFAKKGVCLKLQSGLKDKSLKKNRTASHETNKVYTNKVKSVSLKDCPRQRLHLLAPRETGSQWVR